MKAKLWSKRSSASFGRRSASKPVTSKSSRRGTDIVTSFPSGRKRGHDGKDQTYFLCDFLADDKKINVSTEHPEFRAWKWIEPQKFNRSWLPSMKLDVYALVFRDFFGVEI
jgi:hypothetical protein